MKPFVTVLPSLLILAGCAGLSPARRFTPRALGATKSTIVKGQTTEADVLRMFGAPELVTHDASGREHWHISGLRSVMVTDPETGDVTFQDRQESSTEATQPFDVTVQFTDTGIVRDYRISTVARQQRLGSSEATR